MEKETAGKSIMEVQYLREMRQNYLMIEAKGDWEQRYEARMLVGNTIEGLLKFRIKKMDNRCKFCYEITSKQPLSRLLDTRTMGADQIRTLLLGIAGALAGMEVYLLAEGQILLDPDYIYVDPEEFKPFLCLIPGRSGDFPEEFSRFLQFLLGKADHQDKEAVVLIYGLYRESLKENYGLDNLMKWLLKEDCPDLVSTAKRETCEKIGTAEIESWEAEGPEPSEEEFVTQTSRQTPYVSWLFGTAAVMSAAAAGTFLFMGVQGVARYGIWLAAVGIGTALAGAILWGSRFFVRGTSGSDGIHTHIQPFGDQSPNTSSCDRTSGNTSEVTSSNNQLSFNQTAHNRTSKDSSKRSQLIENPISQLIQTQKETGQGQWQMIFEEDTPDQEETEEFSDSSGSDGQEMQTVLLWNQGEEKKTARSLVSEDGGNDILLSYYPFIIGKQEGLCDYVLLKNTVSRLHIRIDEAEEGYQVTDLNSTNGTFINGRCLEANEAAVAKPGDEIRIADQRFRLK